MQEDVAGTLRTIGQGADVCSLCGIPYPKDQLASLEADPSDGIRSEQEYVCPACGQSLAQGDDPAYPVDADGQPSMQYELG